MPATYINGTHINTAYFNGTNLDKIYFNGALVFSKQVSLVIPGGYHNSGSSINLRKFIDSKRASSDSVITVVIERGSVVPEIVTGNLTSGGLTKVTLINKGEIQAIKAGGPGLVVQSSLHLDNQGHIRGGGGNGGRGGYGGRGASGADTVKTKSVSTPKHTESPVNSDQSVGYGEGTGATCDVVRFGHGKSGTHCTGKVGHIAGLPGTFTKGSYAGTVGEYKWFSIIHNYTETGTVKTTLRGGTGGEGGSGGDGGSGQYYNHRAQTNLRNGNTGRSGRPSSPAGGHSGFRGGKGGAGGDGGRWGQTGSTGARGSRGEGRGSEGLHGTTGSKGGYSITGYSRLTIINRGSLSGSTQR